jgi:GT2 family glycosyltransferase
MFVYRCRDVEGYVGRDVPGLGTCNLMVRHDAFAAAGGFDESLARDEDMDFCLTLRAAGWTFHQTPETLVWHRRAATGRSGGQFAFYSSFRQYVKRMFETRVRLLAKRRPLILPVIPLLDLVIGLRFWTGVKRGHYFTSHLEHVEALSATARLGIIVRESTICYAKAFGLFFRWVRTA